VRKLPDPPDEELVLIGAFDDVETEPGIRLDPERERIDLLRALHLDPRDHPIDPPIDGAWR
jgi:hypothetical protein